MSQIAKRTLAWVGLYLVVCLAPLFLMLVGPLPPGRGFWIEFGVALGFLGMTMMAVQFALTARFPRIGGPFGLDTMMHFHRQAGIIALVFVLAHPMILILADGAYLSFFDPRENLPRTAALSLVTVLLLLVVVLPLCRNAISMPYEWWRTTHGVMAAMIVLIGVAHMFMVGHYVDTWWKQGVWAVVALASIGLLATARVIKPLQLRRRPYRVESIQQEVPHVWTVHLRADGHAGMRFDAGQFVWLNDALTPFLWREHPFTIASSAAHSSTVALTIKELGDFTGQIGQTEPGRAFFLDGPYGMFRLDRAADASELVLIAGGIGITPNMSILRTMRDAGDQRPVMLIYANLRPSSIAFRDELNSLESRMNLQMHHILEEPDKDWTGRCGRLTRSMLVELLDGFTGPHTHYFLCGPEPMMDVVERTLMDRGVGVSRRHVERFHIV